MRNYLFSVIMVCYNSEVTISQAISSVLKQNYKNLELIIVDGKSNDGTTDIIRSFLYDNRVRFISEEDDGIYDAMNKGVTLSKGEVISFLNSDDWYEEDALKHINEFLNNKDCEIVVGQTANIIDSRKIVRKVSCNANTESIHYMVNFSHQGVFAKKKCFSLIGDFNKKYKIAADYDWIIRAHNYGLIFETCDEITSNFRLNGISMSNPLLRYSEYYDVALNNTGNHGYELRQVIDNYYIPIIEHYRCEQYFKDHWCDNEELLRRILREFDEVYIWGVGFYGEYCYKLLTRLGISVIGFIDNYSSESCLHGCKIYNPKELSTDVNIIISSYKYEKDIRKQLQLLLYNEKNIMSLSELEKKYYFEMK